MVKKPRFQDPSASLDRLSDALSALLRTPAPRQNETQRKPTKRQAAHTRRQKRELKALAERLLKPRKKDRGGPRK